MKAAVVTVSTSLARGEGEDVSGPRARGAVRGRRARDHARAASPTTASRSPSALKRLADDERVRFVFTTGGTGLTHDDVTPEATRDVIEREAPGFAEAIRVESRKHTPLGILTRGVSGIRGRTLIVNFPGSPHGVHQSWPVIEPTLKHAAETLERD